MFLIFLNIQTRVIHYYGNINFVQDPALDRSSNKLFIRSKSAKALESFTKQFGMTDPWRYKFPTTKQFSFFSHVDNTYTRIDKRGEQARAQTCTKKKKRKKVGQTCNLNPLNSNVCVLCSTVHCPCTWCPPKWLTLPNPPRKKKIELMNSSFLIVNNYVHIIGVMHEWYRENI